MKTIAVLAAALAVSLTCAGTASAQGFGGDSVTITKTGTDAFGTRRTVTRSRNSDGSESISKSVTDDRGNRRSVTKRRNADGSESISKSVTDDRGNRKSVTKRRNTDGSESITITKSGGQRRL